MINAKLRDFVESVVDRKYISAEDIGELQQNVLAAGISSRSEAEALLTLGRSVETDAGWRQVLADLVVDFVVRSRQAGGAAEHDDAFWLATALDVGGPTENTMAIAYAILDATPHVGPALLDFIMRGRQQERMQSMAA